MRTEKISPFWRAITVLTPTLTDPERVRELRRITGVRQPTVSRWRTGVSPIGHRNALKIARYYKCNVHWLQTYEEDKNAPDDSDPTIQQLKLILESLDEKRKAEIVAIAQVIARGT